jgi:hypothetical protein
MDVQIASALIGGVGGAILGGALSGIITYRATMRSPTLAARLSDAADARNKIIAATVSVITGLTASRAKERSGDSRKEFLAQLDDELERTFKSLYMAGYKDLAQAVDVGCCASLSNAGKVRIQGITLVASY